MKKIIVEDHGEQCGPMRYKVQRTFDTVEWGIGDHLSKSEIERILSRIRQNTVRVEIVPKKG